MIGPHYEAAIKRSLTAEKLNVRPRAVDGCEVWVKLDEEQIQALNNSSPYIFQFDPDDESEPDDGEVQIWKTKVRKQNECDKEPKQRPQQKMRHERQPRELCERVARAGAIK